MLQYEIIFFGFYYKSRFLRTLYFVIFLFFFFVVFCVFDNHYSNKFTEPMLLLPFFVYLLNKIFIMISTVFVLFFGFGYVVCFFSVFEFLVVVGVCMALLLSKYIYVCMCQISWPLYFLCLCVQTVQSSFCCLTADHRFSIWFNLWRKNCLTQEAA